MYMYRSAIEALKKWKSSNNRKPLVMRGARQTGKTELLKYFGQEEYKSYVYVNLEDTPAVGELFKLDLDVNRIIKAIESISQKNIIPGDTLLILDEIQSTPEALTSLKYFHENAPEYHVAVAGSLLGIALHEDISFPVGKVDFFDLHPMSFYEFLIANGKKYLAELIKDTSLPSELNVFHDELVNLMRIYFITGGMPEAVKVYVQESDYSQVRKVQRDIIDAYELDFSKHAPHAEIPRIREIYNSIPACLSRENKKFLFSAIKESARWREYETALLWIEDTDLASRVTRVNSAKLPLSAYASQNVFKLFLSDIGILGAKMGIDPRIILADNDLFIEYKGALAEQFVFQELKANNTTPYYYSNDDSRGEIDFILDLGTKPLPIEVKSGQNTSSVSLNNFLEKWKLEKATKLSLLPLRANERVDNFPLYLAGMIPSYYRS